MTKILSGLLLLVCAVRLQATSVVVFRTPTGIVLGADDGKQTISGEKADTKPTMKQSLCKIRQAGRWWTAQTGFDDVGNVDIYQSIANVVSGTRSLDEAALALQERAFPLFNQLVAARPRAFRTLQPIHGVAIAGTNLGDSTLRVGWLVVYVAADQPGHVTAGWNQCPGPWCEPGGGGLLHFTTGVEPALSLVKPPRPDWVEAADAAAAMKLIQLQHTAKPNSVGPGADVLELSGSGPHWAKRAACTQ